MEGQAFGIPPSYGGPYVGVIATRDKFVRQMPGRLAGQTTDAEGRRGFVLTLATREQHIRREKATSNICTNEALYALAATIHLCLIGKEGLREHGAPESGEGALRAGGAAEKIPGVKLVFYRPTFNEFVLEFPRSVKLINAALLREKIIGPLPLGVHYPELTKRGRRLRHRNDAARGDRTLRRSGSQSSRATDLTAVARPRAALRCSLTVKKENLH